MSKHASKGLVLPLMSPQELEARFSSQPLPTGEDSGENWFRATLLTVDKPTSDQLVSDRIPKSVAEFSPYEVFSRYRANAKFALAVIDAAIERTAKLQGKQSEGEEEARLMQKKVARKVAEAEDASELITASQSATQEAVEHAMRYWGQMFDLISEMQKRLWVMMEGQMEGLPGVKEAKAAMTTMPDLRQAQNVINAMQGVVSSGGSASESMQRVMSDFARMSRAKR